MKNRSYSKFQNTRKMHEKTLNITQRRQKSSFRCGFCVDKKVFWLFFAIKKVGEIFAQIFLLHSKYCVNASRRYEGQSGRKEKFEKKMLEI